MAAHRQIELESYKSAKKNNRLCYPEYSQAPRFNNLLTYLQSLLGLFSGNFLTNNANNSVVRLSDGRILCLTKTVSGSIVIDPTTLDTVGRLEFTDKLWHLIQSPHPIVTEKEFLTLLPDFLRPGYRVVRMEAGTDERKVWAGQLYGRAGDGLDSFVSRFGGPGDDAAVQYACFAAGRARPLKWYPDSASYTHLMCKRSGKIAL